MNQQEENHARETYEKPELVVYGDIREITRSNNGKTGNDGATTGNTKTA